MQISHANVIEHVYRDGYGRPDMNRPFWIVTCGPCNAILNSGHHYTDEAAAHRLAEEHDATVHPTHPKEPT